MSYSEEDYRKARTLLGKVLFYDVDAYEITQIVKEEITVCQAYPKRTENDWNVYILINSRYKIKEILFPDGEMISSFGGIHMPEPSEQMDINWDEFANF